MCFAAMNFNFSSLGSYVALLNGAVVIQDMAIEIDDNVVKAEYILLVN